MPLTPLTLCRHPNRRGRPFGRGSDGRRTHLWTNCFQDSLRRDGSLSKMREAAGETQRYAPDIHPNALPAAQPPWTPTRWGTLAPRTPLPKTNCPKLQGLL